MVAVTALVAPVGFLFALPDAVNGGRVRVHLVRRGHTRAWCYSSSRSWLGWSQTAQPGEVCARCATKLQSPDDAAPEPDVGREWMTDAACRGMDTELWFASGFATNRAARICGTCPVTRECLGYALRCEQDGYRYGVFGGLLPKQRSRLQRRRAVRG